MAANYDAIGSYRTVQVFAGFPLEVEVVALKTYPSEVTALYAVPLDNWKGDEGASILEPIAAGIERFMARPEVAGMRFEEDVDATGQLVSNMVITVQALSNNPTQPGPFTGEVTARMDWFFGQAADTTIGPAVNAEYQRLVALIGQ